MNTIYLSELKVKLTLTWVVQLRIKGKKNNKDIIYYGCGP